MVRGVIDDCTGETGLAVEDDLDGCEGWGDPANPNCTRAKEYEFQSASELQSVQIDAGIKSYGGGGYILKLSGYIDDLQNNLKKLQRDGWVNNRTRSLALEFSVYNAQVNMYGTVTCIAEFVAGGIHPWYRIETFRLSRNSSQTGYVVMMAEFLFIFATFYYFVNLMSVVKREGWSKFWSSNWNKADCLTLILCVVALGLYLLRFYVVKEMMKKIKETRGNEYIRLTYPAMINQYYEYALAIVVFTSTIKILKLISFHRAFVQISATLDLVFIGLADFFVEFSIVFVAFSNFFFFVLKNDLDSFRDFARTLENTIAMSIGKFNFQNLRTADELAAWIFFVFSSKYHNINIF
jgi:hypothetical protein